MQKSKISTQIKPLGVFLSGGSLSGVFCWTLFSASERNLILGK